MDIVTFREFCLSLPGSEESTPFDEETLVYKIGGKIYSCGHISGFREIAVKCREDEVEALRDAHAEITAPRYFNKRHWNTVDVCGDLSEKTIRKLITNSYLLVIQKSVTPKSLREELLAQARAAGIVWEEVF